MRKFECKKSYKIIMLAFPLASFLFMLVQLINFFQSGAKAVLAFLILEAIFVLLTAVLLRFCYVSFKTHFVFFEDAFEYHTHKDTITIKAKNLRYFFYRDGLLTVFFVPDLLESLVPEDAKTSNDAIPNDSEKEIALQSEEILFKIQIPRMGFIKGADEILRWFSENVEVRPDGQALEDLEEIAQQYDFATIENISDVLKKANFIAKILNIAGSLIGVWTWFFPAPYRLCTFLALALPIAVLPVLHFSRGFIRFDKKGNSIYPCICFSPIACTFGLAWRMLNDISIQNVKTFFIFSAIFFALYLTLFLICQKEFSAKKLSDWLSVVLYSFYFAAYSLAAVCAINFLFDFSIPQNNFFKGALGIAWEWAVHP